MQCEVGQPLFSWSLSPSDNSSDFLWHDSSWQKPGWLKSIISHFLGYFCEIFYQFVQYSHQIYCFVFFYILPWILSGGKKKKKKKCTSLQFLRTKKFLNACTPLILPLNLCRKLGLILCSFVLATPFTCVTISCLWIFCISQRKILHSQGFVLGTPDPLNMPSSICQPSPHHHLFSWLSFIFSDVISPNWLISALQVEGEPHVQQLFEVTTFPRRMHQCLWVHPT